jgi:Arc/MetJ-type ribon-helix-helix transcriptional regulator
MTGKTWRIKIIEGDRQGSSAYYPKEVVEAGKHLFGKGVRSFKNHPSADEKWNRPERSIDDIVGYLSESAEYDGKDLWASLTIVESERERIKELAEAGLIDISIRAAGEMVEGTNGMELKKFTAVHSVDIVTQGGAGGKFGEVLESDRKQVSASESVAESKEKEETMELPKEFTDALDALVESGKQTATAVAALVERATNEDKAKAEALEEAKKAGEAKAPSAAEIAGALVEAELPKAAHAKVIAAVESGTELAEAISAEKKYLETIVEESGKEGFKGNGSDEIQESAHSKIGSSIFG